MEQQAASDPRSAAVATGGEGGGMQDSAVPKDAGEKQGGLSPRVLILTALILAAFGCLIGYTRARAGRTKKNTAA